MSSFLNVIVLAPDSTFYIRVEGSLVTLPSQECVVGVGMQLSLGVKEEYHYRVRQNGRLFANLENY